MQKQIGPILIILLVVMLAVAGWFYWSHLNTESTGSISNPAPVVNTPSVGGNNANGIPQQGAPSKAMSKPFPKPTGQ